MPANECIPFKEPGGHVTGTPTAAVTGKRCVVISGDRNADGTYSVAPAGAGVKAFGVAQQDAGVGVRVTIIRSPGIIIPVTSGAAIAAGQGVEVDATGRVIPLAAGARVGTALTGVGAADLDAHIAWD